MASNLEGLLACTGWRSRDDPHSAPSHTAKQLYQAGFMLVSEVPSGEVEQFDEAGLQHVLSQAQAQSVVRRTHLAILPLFCCICAACYIDRTNLAFASMHLNEDLNFTPEGEHPPHLQAWVLPTQGARLHPCKAGMRGTAQNDVSCLHVPCCHDTWGGGFGRKEGWPCRYYMPPPC